MKKIKINKEIFIYLFFAVITGASILIKQLNDLDEMWIFNFSRNMANGLLPYKDFNMILTPLLPIICSTFLKIFGTELIVMRVIAICSSSTILFLLYKIFQNLGITKNANKAFTILIFLILMEHFRIDYNFLVLLFLLIILLLELKKSEHLLEDNFRYNLFIGILAGITVLFKQSTGIVILIVCSFYKILIISKSDLKKFLVESSTRILGGLIPIVMLVIYLLVNDIWFDFLDYAIYGIKTFSNVKTYLNLILNYGIAIKVLAIICPIAMIYMFIRTVVMKIKTAMQQKLFIVFCFSVASIAVIYPIADSIHFLIGNIPILIGIFYIIWTFYLKIKNKYKDNRILEAIEEYFMAILKIVTISITSISIIYIFAYLLDSSKYTKLRNFKYIPNEISQSIIDLDQYILEKENEGKNVYILDASAAMYMIPLDRYNKDFDMFLLGNLGSKGEKGQIEKLEKISKNTIFLVKNDTVNRNWQNPEEVREYIKANWNKTVAISYFDVYEKY